MKNTLKIASLSLVLSVIAATGAHAAASVRSFGGSGVYNSAASASEKKATGPAVRGTTAGTTAARSGSMRVTPSSNKVAASIASKGTTSTVGRAAAMPRLSVGNHLGANSVTPGGGSINPASVEVGDANVVDFESSAKWAERDALRVTTDLGRAYKEHCTGDKTCLMGYNGDGTVAVFEVVDTAVVPDDDASGN